MKQRNFQAAILDTDGVITKTAATHGRAWKTMFDDYLRQRPEQAGESHEPFDVESDYRQYVDGKPRYDGVRSFLASRGIELPWGSEDDAADQETICGLGNRKNVMFRQLLDQGGIEAYEDTVAQIENWKRAGLKVAVISASRNCEAILKAVGLLQLFDAKIDGNDAARLGIKGKPAPDVFLKAAEQLGVDPADALIVEDAISGVEAGRAGAFALVVGVDRVDAPDELWDAGADCVVRDLRELEADRLCPPGDNCLKTPAAALANTQWLADQLSNRQLAVFLDYDGTLTPIVRRPELATISNEMKQLLGELGELCTVAIVSGRDRRNVEQMVGLDDLVYAGSHGFDIRGPSGLEMQHQDAQPFVGELDQVERKLQAGIESVAGAHLERKKYGIAVHYREVAEPEVARVADVVDAVRGEHAGLRKRGGKKVFELQPDIEWHKGYAVMWLAEALGIDRASASILYIGDDLTDEDAFRELRRRDAGIGILVAGEPSRTAATYCVRDCDEVYQFLKSLTDMLRQK